MDMVASWYLQLILTMTMQSTMIGEDVEASHEVSGLAPTNFLFSLHEMRENQENSTIVIGFVAIHVATGMSIGQLITHLAYSMHFLQRRHCVR